MRILVVTNSRRTAWFRNLAGSAQEHHPDVTVDALWSDARLSRGLAADAVSPHGIDAGGHRWADLVLALGERRAAWAALPWVLDRMGTDGPVLVLDDTFVVLGSLGPLVRPDPSAPAARVARLDADGTGWGGALPGAVLLPGGATGVRGWWRTRALSAVATPGWAGSVDPWWELPVGSDLLADPGLRLAASTAGEMELTMAGHALAADGRPLALVDLAGLRPDRPWWFAPADGEPTRFLSDSPALRRLCHDQAERLLVAGWSPAAEAEDEEAVVGMRTTPAMRSWYRSLLGGRAGVDLPPNPLVPGQVAAFLDLLGGPGRDGGSGASQLGDQVLDARPDLRQVFPHPRWRDRDGFQRWLWSHGLVEGLTSLAVLGDPPRPRPSVVATPGRRPFGVNLVGYLDADLGLGVAARRMQHALEAAGVPTATVSYDRTSSNLRSPSAGGTARPFHANLLLITPDQLPLFVDDVGADFLAGHHNIGLWYWESDVLTPQQESAFAFVDEVWAATTYLRDVFARAGRVPVSLVPSPLVFDDPAVGPSDRSRLGLDDRFTFLFSFDFLSVVERKNPLGLLEAYQRAFGPDDGTRLIIKSINGHVFPQERERLMDAVADRPDVEVWDRLLPAADRLALVAAADCYVSLHRSEGLGLTMAEAMAVGTPVIATAYSGNLDFMDDRSALLVPCTEVEVGPGQYYPAQGHWAEPDLGRAAELMARVREDSALRSELATAGRRALKPFGYDPVGAVAMERLVDGWRQPS